MVVGKSEPDTVNVVLTPWMALVGMTLVTLGSMALTVYSYGPRVSATEPFFNILNLYCLTPTLFIVLDIEKPLLSWFASMSIPLNQPPPPSPRTRSTEYSKGNELFRLSWKVKESPVIPGFGATLFDADHERQGTKKTRNAQTKNL